MPTSDIGGSADYFFPNAVPRFTTVRAAHGFKRSPSTIVRRIVAPVKRASGFVGSRSRENGQGVTATE